MDSKTLELDHFRAYNVDGVTTDLVVGLEGQFDDGMRKHRLVSIDHFANPVDKNGEGIRDEHSHQNWYAIHPDDRAEPPRVARVANQFGDFELRLGDAELLIVPAEKIEKGSKMPDPADHFKCYRVEEAEALGRAVTLRDQFRRDRVSVLEPLLFGVPVAKHFRELEKIHNETAHLTIYRLDSVPHSETRRVRDQFDTWELPLDATALLAVPTRKIKWAVISS